MIGKWGQHIWTRLRRSRSQFKCFYSDISIWIKPFKWPNCVQYSVACYLVKRYTWVLESVNQTETLRSRVCKINCFMQWNGFNCPGQTWSLLVIIPISRNSWSEEWTNSLRKLKVIELKTCSLPEDALWFSWFRFPKDAFWACQLLLPPED